MYTINAASQQENVVKQIRGLLSGKRNATRRSITQSVGSFLGYCGEAYPSQTTLGKKAGVKRETACRSLKTLRNKIIVIGNRGYKKTRQYWYTSEFLNNRHHFYDLIPALRQLSLLMLFSITSNVYSQNVTQYKEYIGAKRRSEFSLFKFKANEANGYSFYDKDYGKLITTHIFNQPNKQTTPLDWGHPLEGESMQPKSVITLLSEAYGLSRQQEEMLNNYSEEALQYAVKAFVVAKKNGTINAPIAWIAKVASKHKKSPTGFLNGNEVGHSTSSKNPQGHSPMGTQSNLTLEEREAFASYQESLWEEIVELSPSMESVGFHSGYVERVKANWKRIAVNPKEFPASSDIFKLDKEQAEQYTEGPDYEAHLDQISADKSNPAEYKLMVRRYDYRRTSRK